MKNWLGRTIIFFCGLAVSLIVLETGLRILGSGYGDIQINQDLKKTDANNVLCIGDSFTWGIGGGKGGSYPEHLDRLLPNINVFNGGMGGANTAMMLEVAQKLMSELTPKVIVVTGGGANFMNYAGYKQPIDLSELRIIKLFKYWTNLKDKTIANSLPKVSPYDRYIQKRPDTEFKEAIHQLESRQCKNAEQTFITLSHKFPNDPFPHWGLGHTYICLDDLSIATEFFEKAVALDPQEPEILFALGFVYRERGLLEQSAKTYEKCLDSAPCICGLATIKGVQNNHPVSYDLFIKGITTDPTDYRCYVPQLRQTAEAYGKLGDLKQRLSETNSAIAQTYLNLYGIKKVNDEIWKWIGADLSQLAFLAQQYDTTMIIQSYPQDHNINLFLRGIAEKNNLIFLDQEAHFLQLEKQGVDGLFINDGHCTSKGYLEMAKNLKPIIEQIIEK